MPLKIDAKQELIHILQLAFSGEKGASHAYEGHWKSVWRLAEKKKIQEIQKEELIHRECVGRMLRQLKAAPRKWLEFKMSAIGKAIGFLCHFGGWFIPMYGAGRLESKNVKEYEEAARHAVNSGNVTIVEDLLKMAEVEWDHEKYFRQLILAHPLYSFFPKWEIPPPKKNIRDSFEHFLKDKPLLVKQKLLGLKQLEAHPMG